MQRLQSNAIIISKLDENFETMYPSNYVAKYPYKHLK